MKDIFDGLDNWKDPNRRDYASMCVFGDLGKGKSTFLRQIANMYVDKTQTMKVPRKVLICDPSRAVGFRQFPQITLAELKLGVVSGQKVHRWAEDGTGIRVLRNVNWKSPEFWQILSDNFINGFVILDESRNYIPKKAELGPEQMEFFTIHRNNAVDVMVVSHDFMNMNLDLRKAFRYYFVFRTGDRPDGEQWFTQRTLPEALYPIWLMLQQFRVPDAKMQPMVVYDKETGRQRFYLHPDSISSAQVFWPDPKNPGKKVLVPLASVKKQLDL